MTDDALSDGDSSWLAQPEPGWTPITLPHMVAYDTFLSGHPSGDRLRIHYFRRDSDGALMAKAWFGPGTQGPPGHAHGGSTAALLDEVMGGAAWIAGHAVVAVELTARFKEMLPLETYCVVEASVVRVQGRKVWTRAELQGRDGTLFADSDGLFIELDKDRFGSLVDLAAEMLRNASGQ